MPTVEVKDLSNKVVGEISLSDEIFGAPLNEALIYDAVKNFLANQRQGNSATKTRGNTSGSGKKLWKQKGTGRARIASLRSPLWKGGGNVHGPQPRDWSYELPKKMKRGALRSALSERLREGNLLIVEDLNLSDHKTKNFVAATKALGLDKRALFIDAKPSENFSKAARNVPGMSLAADTNVNIYDVIYHEKIVLTREAVNVLQAKLSK